MAKGPLAELSVLYPLTSQVPEEEEAKEAFLETDCFLEIYALALNAGS